MKKILLAMLIFVMVISTVTFAAGRETPWDNNKVNICLAESFSDREDGPITWDDGDAGFWTGTAFYEWPDAQWKDGQLVMTNFPGLNGGGDTRMTFRINTNEIQNVSAVGSVGVGFYVENNTANVQSIGFYMVGVGCCLKHDVGKKITFISTSGKKTDYTVGNKDYAMIPAGEKGWIIGFYEDFDNLWSSDPYTDIADDPIRSPGFELINLLVDGDKGETVVIDNVFFFGKDIAESHSDIVLNGGSLPSEKPSATAAPTKEPTKAPTTAPTKEPTKAPTTAPTKAPTTAPTEGATDAPAKETATAPQEVTTAPVVETTAPVVETTAPSQEVPEQTEPATDATQKNDQPSESATPIVIIVPNNDVIVYVAAAVILIAAVVAAVMILRKKQ